MAILDDIITKENRPHLVGSPEEHNAVRTIVRNNQDYFRASRGCRDYLVGARVKASKANTFVELREAIDVRIAAHKRYVDAVMARQS